MDATELSPFWTPYARDASLLAPQTETVPNAAPWMAVIAHLREKVDIDTAKREKLKVARQKKMDEKSAKKPPPTEKQIKARKAATAKRAKRAVTETRCRKIQIYPTPEQVSILRTTVEACHHIYNTAALAKNEERPCDVKTLRAIVVNNCPWEAICKVHPTWNIVPYEVRDGALQDALKAIKSTEASIKKRVIYTKVQSQKPWKFRMRGPGTKTASFTVSAHDLNHNSYRATNKAFFETLFGKWDSRHTTLKSHQLLPGKFGHDARVLHRILSNAWFLVVTEEVVSKPSVLSLSHTTTSSFTLVGASIESQSNAPGEQVLKATKKSGKTSMCERTCGLGSQTSCGFSRRRCPHFRDMLRFSNWESHGVRGATRAVPSAYVESESCGELNSG
jgi:hypothetical protein